MRLPALVMLLSCQGEAERDCPLGSHLEDDGLCHLDESTDGDGGTPGETGGDAGSTGTDGDAGSTGADGGAPTWQGGDCWVQEDPPPDDSALSDEEWSRPVYIAGSERRFETIQNAIWGAEEGDTVVVKPGTYVGTVDLVGKVITLCSEQGPAVTIIDADGEGPAVRLRAYEPAETVIQGFTITGGVGEGDDVFGPTPHGGGVFIEWGSPTIRHNLIVGNEADIGGGVYVRNGAATVENNVIAWNHANQGGGGLTCSACRGRIAYNSFYDNTGSQGPLMEYFWGAADFVGNLAVLPGTEPAVRWLDPRPDVEWLGGPNLLWPDVELLQGADDGEWPDLDSWRIADPLLDVDPDAPAQGWTLSKDSAAVDCGPAEDNDADGSPADCGAFGGPHGDWATGG